MIGQNKNSRKLLCRTEALQNRLGRAFSAKGGPSICAQGSKSETWLMSAIGPKRHSLI